MSTIDLEAHFYTQAVFDYLATRKDFPLFVKETKPGSYTLRFTEHISLFQTTEFITTLCNLGRERIKAMDDAGLDVQVLSFSSPGIDEITPDHQSASRFARELNDIIFETMKS